MAGIQDFFDTLQQRYEEYRDQAGDNQLAVIRCYTQAGEVIRVAHVTLYKDSGPLVFRGNIQDEGPCDLIVDSQTAQVVLRLLTLPEPPTEEERKSIGFTR